MIIIIQIILIILILLSSIWAIYLIFSGDTGNFIFAFCLLFFITALMLCFISSIENKKDITKSHDKIVSNIMG